MPRSQGWKACIDTEAEIRDEEYERAETAYYGRTGEGDDNEEER